eukprot:GFUD01024811.1.p1 GENE.GFUD01024811.1~~GFUD01024811.1.p1  ORF type:complete len:513 (+),score=109.47 GFUD01024811.1:67-1605(+)
MTAKETQLFKQTFENLFLKGRGVSRDTEDSGIAEDLSTIDIDSDDTGEPEMCPVHKTGKNEDQNAQDPDIFIYSLPQEIWLKILQQLKSSELCVIGLVSKGFLNLTRDPSLWPELCLVGDAIGETSSVVNLISRCSNLSEISITSREGRHDHADISDLILALSNSCHQLKHLEVKECQPLTYTDLSELSTGCSKLETINLDMTGCLNGDVHKILWMDPIVGEPIEGSNGVSLPFSVLFGKFKKLTCLNLFECGDLHSEGLEFIADCDNLERLNIDAIDNLSDKSVNRFIELRGKKMKKLWIDGESLSDESFGNFEKMTNLELLSVSFADSLGALGLASISKLAKLEWLKLRRGEDLEPVDFVNAFSFGKLEKLIHLDLSQCSKIDDNGIIAVAKHCPRLGTLSLEWCCEITDVGLACIVNKCKDLLNLNLCGGFGLLGNFLPSINQLQLLDLEQCPYVQLAVLKDLVRQNMNLVIKDYYGEEVTPGRKFSEILLDHPEISFISYDHEYEEYS